MKKIFLTLFSIMTFSSIYSQEIENIDNEQNLLSKCFSDLSLIQAPDHPIFQTNLCSILECLMMFRIINKIKEPIDLTKYKKKLSNV